MYIEAVFLSILLTSLDYREYLIDFTQIRKKSFIFISNFATELLIVFYIHQEVLIVSGPYLTCAAAYQVVEGLSHLYYHLYYPPLI
jgi:hypothetical protein